MELNIYMIGSKMYILLTERKLRFPIVMYPLKTENKEEWRGRLMGLRTCCVCSDNLVTGTIICSRSSCIHKWDKFCATGGNDWRTMYSCHRREIRIYY